MGNETVWVCRGGIKKTGQGLVQQGGQGAQWGQLVGTEEARRQSLLLTLQSIVDGEKIAVGMCAEGRIRGTSVSSLMGERFV